jgi:hypothetical protein
MKVVASMAATLIFRFLERRIWRLNRAPRGAVADQDLSAAADVTRTPTRASAQLEPLNVGIKFIVSLRKIVGCSDWILALLRI